jgi:hypothetical protein
MIGCVPFHSAGNCEYNTGNGFHPYFLSRGVGEVPMIVRPHASRQVNDDGND